MFKFFAAIPAILAWSTILAMFLFSWLLPTWVAIFIILFDIYWLLKTVYLSFHLHQTFKQMKINLKIDWLQKIKHLPFTHQEKFNQIYHLILLPFYKESYEVIKDSLDSLAASNYPSEKIIVVLGVEERAGADALADATRLTAEFKDSFFKIITTVHPQGLPHEIPGKGSNESFMAEEVKAKIIDPLNIPYSNIITSSFDIDTRVFPEYFGVLTHKFLTTADPLHTSYQPIPLFINNIYDTPALARVVSFSATFWQMMQQARPERLTTFSSHSMPFQALVDVNFWERDLVSEDSRIFWQLLFHYNANWKVVPLNYPLSMDANNAPTFWQTMVNVYKQQRRWAWGVENTPYLLWGFYQNKIIPLRTKLYWIFVDLEGRHSWATSAFILFALGWLPLLLGGEHFNYSLISYSLPQITRFIMTLAMVGIISSAVISMAILPPKPKWFRPRHYFLFLIQWLLMPVTLIVFGALPGLDAQTRIALGKRFSLGFWVTPKYRQSRD